uniref:Uncharacterized protein n=1 Tax=Lepeophtheirus salmonis TaxID=72036 RepID=A0A0K2VEC1_LEPSM
MDELGIYQDVDTFVDEINRVIKKAQ